MRVVSVYVCLPCVSPSPFCFRPVLPHPSSDQTHRGGSHVCFALGTNFAATFRCKCPRPRPAPTHRREAVERSRTRAGAEKESCSEVRTESEGDVDSMCLTDNRHKRRQKNVRRNRGHPVKIKISLYAVKNVCSRI